MAEPITTPDTLAVYVHWPFCRSLCPYCDFNSHLADEVDHERWRAALVRELDHYAAQAGPRRVTSIFFGGGTPSLMAPETAAALIDGIAQRFALADDVEITLEANPTSAEAARLAAFATAGINRVSLGVQALDDAVLAFLGRTHTADDAIAAIEAAAATFARYSFDLIYTRPGQSVAAWRRELARALALARGHVSLYQLIIEPGTPFYLAQARGDLRLPADDVAGGLFETTQAMTAEAGLPAYEISNHAAPGEACRHNLTYWRYGDYLGLGPGAHGRLTVDGAIHATRQHRAPAIWLRQVEQQGHASRTHAPLDAATAQAELVMMGLRLTDGIDAANFHARVGASFDDALDGAALERLIAGGFIVRDAGAIRATAAGRQRLDAVIAALLG